NMVPKGQSMVYEYAVKSDASGPVASIATARTDTLLFNAPPTPIDRIFQSWLAHNSEIFAFHHRAGHRALIVGKFTSLDNGDNCFVVFYIINDKDEIILDSTLIQEHLKLDGSERYIKAQPIIELGHIQVSPDQIVTCRGLTEQKGSVVGLPYQEKLDD